MSCEKCDQCGGCRQQPKLIIGCRPGSEEEYEEFKRKQMEQAQKDMATILKQLNVDELNWVDQETVELGDVIQVPAGTKIGWQLKDEYPYDHTKFTSEQFLHHLTGGERSPVDPSLRQLFRDSFHGATKADDTDKEWSHYRKLENMADLQQQLHELDEEINRVDQDPSLTVEQRYNRVSKIWAQKTKIQGQIKEQE
jgi:hypothetical protein